MKKAFKGQTLYLILANCNREKRFFYNNGFRMLSMPGDMVEINLFGRYEYHQGPML